MGRSFRGSNDSEEGATGSSAPGRLVQVENFLLSASLEGLTRFAQLFSIEQGVKAGALFGRLWFRFRMPRTRRVEDQLRAAYPDVSATDLGSWSQRVFEHFGTSLAELILLRGRHRDRLLESVEIDGLENMTAAETATESGGVLIVTAHYGNWELAGLSAARHGLRPAAIFRGRDQPVLDRELLAIRAGPVSSAEDYEQIRIGRAGIGLVRALRRGRHVMVLLDQDAKREEGVFVPFFGRGACVQTGSVRLATDLGIPIVPAFIRRNAEGPGHRITIYPALLEEPAGRVDDGVVHARLRDLTAIIEAEIRKDPTQWIWTHRRWKTRPSDSA